VYDFLLVINSNLGWKIETWIVKICSMLKVSYAASPCLYQLISPQFALEMCLTARNHQKIHNPYFGV